MDRSHSQIQPEIFGEIWKNDIAQEMQFGSIKLRPRSHSSAKGIFIVTEYFTKLKELWDELNMYLVLPTCTCGAAKEFNKLLEEEKTHKFLMGLNPTKFENTRSNILQLEPLPNLNKVFAAVARDERQRQIAHETLPKPPVDAAAMKVTVGDRSKPFNQPNRPKCTHCNKLGHEKSQCFELVGYPSNWGNRKNPRDSQQQNRGN